MTELEYQFYLGIDVIPLGHLNVCVERAFLNSAFSSEGENKSPGESRNLAFVPYLDNRLPLSLEQVTSLHLSLSSSRVGPQQWFPNCVRRGRRAPQLCDSDSNKIH